MREISDQLRPLLRQKVTQLATCWRIHRRDGVLITLSSHDQDILFEGVRYRAAGGLDASAIRETADLAVDNLELSGILTAASLDERDLAEGRFDGARVEIFLIDWSMPDAGRLLLKKGDLGRVSEMDGLFEAEMRGLSQTLSRGIIENFSASCRAELGDRRCKRSLLSFMRESRISDVLDDNIFLAPDLEEEENWYAFGRIIWHSGGNGGLESEARLSSPGRIELFQAPPQKLSAGDVFTIIAGCNKTLAVCKGKFDNIANFRGEPFVPGIDKLVDYPGLR